MGHRPWAFYTVAAGAFSVSFGEWWPLAAFWGLTLNRLMGVLVGRTPTGRERHALHRSWAATALLFFLFLFVTALVPVPAFGITAEITARQRFVFEGLWVEEPQKALALGVLYFAAAGASELVGHSWLRIRPAR